MAENYIRPPTVAREAPNQRAAVWRFRAYLLIAAALFIAGVIMIFIAITGNKNDNPELGGTLPAMHVPHIAHHSAGITSSS
jgi:hypothetical protein